MNTERMLTLLRAAKEIIEQCPAAQESSVFYDEAVCDGYCLIDDITLVLDEAKPDKDKT